MVSKPAGHWYAYRRSSWAHCVQQIGALAIGASNTNWDFIDWYSEKSPVSVIGWIGGNILRGFRITIDDPNHTSYWLPETELDGHDLDQVGLTLEANGGEYFVTAIATKNWKRTVEAVQVGDKLLQIGPLRTATATWGEISFAMHGRPGELRTPAAWARLRAIHSAGEYHGVLATGKGIQPVGGVYGSNNSLSRRVSAVPMSIERIRQTRYLAPRKVCWYAER
jgi:hypothetical protein